MIVFHSWGAASVLADDEASGETLVIDPGNQFELISQFLTEKKRTLLAVLLTDGDLPHAARAWELATKFKCPVMAHASALFGLQRLPAEGEKQGLCGVKSPQIGRFLHPGERFPIGSIEVEVLVTEGADRPRVTYVIENRRFDGFPSNVNPLSSKPN